MTRWALQILMNEIKLCTAVFFSKNIQHSTRVSQNFKHCIQVKRKHHHNQLGMHFWCILKAMKHSTRIQSSVQHAHYYDWNITTNLVEWTLEKVQNIDGHCNQNQSIDWDLSFRWFLIWIPVGLSTVALMISPCMIIGLVQKSHTVRKHLLRTSEYRSLDSILWWNLFDSALKWLALKTRYMIVKFERHLWIPPQNCLPFPTN